MTGLIKGNDVLFLVDKGDGYVPYVCAKDLSIETNSSLIPVTTIGDGEWDRFKYSSLGYTVNLSGVSRFTEDDFSSFDFIHYQHNFLELTAKIVFTDQEDLNRKTFKCQLLIERSNMTGNAGAFSLFDMTLRGNGKYNIVSCNALIGSISTFALDESTIQISLGDVTGSPDKFFYQLDTDFEVEVTETTFNLLNVTGGEHTLIVTPVCASGERGESFVYDFANTVIEENASCGVPTAITITDQGLTSFRVNWIYGTGNTGINIYIKNTRTGEIQKFLNNSGTSLLVQNQIGSNLYEVTVQANCGGAGLSAKTVVQARTALSTNIAKLIINNASDTVTINRVKIGAITLLNFPVDPHTSFVVNLTNKIGSLQVDYNSIAGDASIQVITQYQTVCQIALPSGAFSNIYGPLNSGSGDIIININPHLCP